MKQVLDILGLALIVGGLLESLRKLFTVVWGS